MPSLRSAIVTALVAAATATSFAVGADQSADAARFNTKVQKIRQFGARPTRSGQRTVLTQDELNAFLQSDARQHLPVGVIAPSISMAGERRLVGRAIVNLDVVRKQHKSTGMLDPMNYLAGRVPVTATGVLTTGKGTGQFELESATLAGVPLPKSLLQEIVSYYSRSPQDADGIDLDKSFPLPERIQEVQVGVSQAIVVQ